MLLLAMTCKLGFLHYDIRNDIPRFIAAICRVREMPIDFAKLQHLDHMMNIFGTCKLIGDGFSVNALYTVLKRFGTLGMVNGDRGILLQPQDSLIDLVSRVLQERSDTLHIRRWLDLEHYHLTDCAV